MITQLNAFGTPMEEAEPTTQYQDLTLEQRFQIGKANSIANARSKHGDFLNNKQEGPTYADLITEQKASKITVHADGSVTTKKGVLGNDKSSAELVKLLREQAYKRYNINE